jgi:hypothetical protein
MAVVCSGRSWTIEFLVLNSLHLLFCSGTFTWKLSASGKYPARPADRHVHHLQFNQKVCQNKKRQAAHHYLPVSSTPASLEGLAGKGSLTRLPASQFLNHRIIPIWQDREMSSGTVYRSTILPRAGVRSHRGPLFGNDQKSICHRLLLPKKSTITAARRTQLLGF